MNGRQCARCGAAILMFVAYMFTTGCETEDRQESLLQANLEAADEAADEAAAPADLFHTEVTLYRRYTGSKWRLDKDHVFTVKDESHIKARVGFRNVRPDRTYSVHLAWIRPDGREMFRRYAEVTRHQVRLPLGVMPDSTGVLPASVIADLAGQFGEERAVSIGERLAAEPESAVPVTEVVYKKAVDLGYALRKISLSDKPRFNLETRINISREKERELGDYLLRIYLDRRLLQEIPFTIQENG